VQTFIVLLRGVNVGGKNLLPMKPLVALLEQKNIKRAMYYIQSGNLLIESDVEPSKIIASVIFENFGFAPNMFVLSFSDFITVLENNPFKEFAGKLVHCYFCESLVEPNKEKISKWISATEQYHVNGNIFYFLAPDGVGRSKLAANIEACIGQAGTGRNLNTINKLKVLAEKF